MTRLEQIEVSMILPVSVVTHVFAAEHMPSHVCTLLTVSRTLCHMPNDD